jgi:hypothetical protein
MHELFSRYGLPEQILSDTMAQTLQQYSCRSCSVCFTSPLPTKGHGMVEYWHRVLKIKTLGKADNITFRGMQAGWACQHTMDAGTPGHRAGHRGGVRHATHYRGLGHATHYRGLGHASKNQWVSPRSTAAQGVGLFYSPKQSIANLLELHPGYCDHYRALMPSPSQQHGFNAPIGIPERQNTQRGRMQTLYTERQNADPILSSCHPLLSFPLPFSFPLSLSSSLFFYLPPFPFPLH